MREQITYPPPLDDIHISRHGLDSINVPLILTLPWLFGVNDILSVTFIFGISFEMPKQTLDMGFLLSGGGTGVGRGVGISVDAIVPLDELWEMSDGKKF